MNKSNLLKALKLCKPALGGNLLKGLESYHFKGNTVTAFNGSLLIKAELEQEFPITGSISGKTLYELVNELNEEIELSTNDGNLVIRSGRSKTVFPAEQIDTEFLSDSEESGGKNYLPTQLLFAAGLKRCMSTVGGKGIPQTEVGIHVFIDTPSGNHSKSECKMYSTNGMAFSRFVYPLDAEMAVNQVFLPASFCEQLIALYSELNAVPDEIVTTQKYVRARFGNVVLRHSFYANPVSWEMRSEVDEAIDKTTPVDLPKEILESIKRSEIVTGNSTITLKYGDPEGKLYISAKGNKNQSLLEEIDLSYPIVGSLNVEVKGLRKIMESCKDIGFGEDYMLLIGSEDFYDLILAAKAG